MSRSMNRSPHATPPQLVVPEASIPDQLAALQGMSASQLQVRYQQVFGEQSRSGNRQWLLRRVAWRIQALAEGGLSERALKRAAELARDADIRVRPPNGAVGGVASYAFPCGGSIQRGVSVCGKVRLSDLPAPGTVLTRQYRGAEHRVTVLPEGFEYNGETYRSLSAVASAITGSHWSGKLFFGLRKDAGHNRKDSK
ncbi:MAG: DUF2924 domain-containing protein [Phycisphaerales bacterium]